MNEFRAEVRNPMDDTIKETVYGDSLKEVMDKVADFGVTGGNVNMYLFENKVVYFKDNIELDRCDIYNMI